MEEEQIQPILEPTPEPTQEPTQEQPAAEDLQTDPPANMEQSENPVNMGITDPSLDPENNFNDENAEENVKVEGQEQAGSEDQTDGETDTGEGTEEGDGSVTNITIVRPPAQIAYSVNADTEATYHVAIENELEDPVPVLVTEILIEQDPDPGIMEKKLEDYSVTEGLLLLILLTLWLRMIFDYLGRRKS